MPAGFPRKTILTLLWIVPTITLTAFISERVVRAKNPPPPVPPEIIRVPVEIIHGSEKPRIIYVDLETNSIPEPSSLLLVPFSMIALLRRKR